MSGFPEISAVKWVCRCPVAVPYIFGGVQSRLENIDRCHSLGSFLPPPAAVASLPGLSPPVRVRPPLHIRKERPQWGRSFLGAGGRTRTGTMSPSVDFESTTSTNSITPAVTRTVYTISSKIARGNSRKRGPFLGPLIFWHFGCCTVWRRCHLVPAVAGAYRIL